jgi:hypothetical protein
MAGRFKRLADAVPWNKWPQFLGAGIIGSIAVCVIGVLFSQFVPAEVTPQAHADSATTVTQSGTGNALSTGQSSGPTIGTQNNYGPCSGASGSSRPDCSTHITIIRRTVTVGRPDNDFVGVLVPSNQPNPKFDSCNDSPLSKRPFTVYFGGSTFVVRHFPFALITIQKAPIFQIDVGKNGRMEINAQIWSRDGRIVAMIDKNRFHVNPNTIFYEKRTKSSLLVYDEFNAKVLDIQYINPRAVIIDGNLYYKGQVVLDDENGIHFLGVNGITFRGMCAEGNASGGFEIGGASTKSSN